MEIKKGDRVKVFRGGRAPITGKVEAVTKGSVVTYEALITKKGKKQTEVMVSGDGSVAK